MTIHSLEAEQGVLGSMLLDPERVIRLIKNIGVSEDMFFLAKHKILFNAMLEVESLDTLTLGDYVESKALTAKIGGRMYIDDLIDATPTDLHADYYIGILVDKYERRSLIAAANKTIKQVKDDSEVGEIISGVESSVAEIKSKSSTPKSNLVTFASRSGDIERYFNDKEKFEGLGTGYTNLDKYFRHRKGNLVIVTGIPSSGKSELMDQLMLKTMEKHDWRWCIFSPENYPPEYHFQKLAEKYIGKPMFKRYGQEGMSKADMEKALKFYDERLSVITPSDDGLTLEELLNKIKYAKSTMGCDGVILDPLNEIEHKMEKGLTETQYISLILSKMRNFARLYEIELFLVAHPKKMFARDDTGEYPVPSLYDIAGSANFYNKADMGISVWRSFQDRNSNVTEVHITKVRDKNLGGKGKCELEWDYITGQYNRPC